MQKAAKGDVVRVHYTGRLVSGEVFDSSEGRDPLEFTLGSGMVIAGFDKGVTGMGVGESKTITIPAAEAYGEAREDMIATLSKAQVMGDIEPKVGQQLEMMTQDGQRIRVKVKAVTAETVTLDANHQLAGQDLIFDLTLNEVVA